MIFHLANGGAILLVGNVIHPAEPPGVLQVFRQQLALYLRAETHRRRDKKGEKVEKIEDVVEERHPGPSENTQNTILLHDQSVNLYTTPI